jgi:hypothetical protein
MTQDAQSTIVTPGVQAGRPILELRAERRELQNQLDALRSEQRQIRFTMGRLPRDAREEPLMQEQLVHMDVRIADMERQLAVNETEMALATPRFVTMTGAPDRGLPRIPDEYVALGSLFMLITLLPMSIVLARRFWKRGPTSNELPAELAARLSRMENVIEATALEVERIGEGQRFVTQLISEQRKESAPSPLLDKSREQAMLRQATPH